MNFSGGLSLLEREQFHTHKSRVKAQPLDLSE